MIKTRNSLLLLAVIGTCIYCTTAPASNAETSPSAPEEVYVKPSSKTADTQPIRVDDCTLLY